MCYITFSSAELAVLPIVTLCNYYQCQLGTMYHQCCSESDRSWRSSRQKPHWMTPYIQVPIQKMSITD